VKAIDAVWGFGLSAEAESVGLDRAEHGEVGFDLGGATLEEFPEVRPPEPRPALVPRDGVGRYTVVVEGPGQKDLLGAWSKLCQAGAEPSAEFRAVYPWVTTVQGNRFRFRGGDPDLLQAELQQLLTEAAGKPVSTHVEPV
jgi:ammonium transporter, Amt family